MASATPDLPTVTFPAAGHHRPLTGTRLYCLVTEAHVCEQLAQDYCQRVPRLGADPGTFRSPVSLVTDILPSHRVEQCAAASISL